MTEVATEPPGGYRRRRPSGEPPPIPHELNRAAVAAVVAFCFFALIWLWVFLSDQPAIWITRFDLRLMRPLVDHRIDGLDPVMEWVNHVGTHWLTVVVGWIVLIGALLARRVRHAVLLIASLSLSAAIVNVVAAQIKRPRPLGFEIRGDWQGFAQPSRPLALVAAALVACTLTLVPKRRRRVAHVVTSAILVVFGFAQVYVAVDHPTDVLAGATVGIAVTLVLYRAFAPESVFPITYRRARTAHLDVSGQRGEAIRKGLRGQLDIDAETVEHVGLAGSSGSTPLRIVSTDGSTYFGKLYSRTHLRSDRSYKLWRTLVYGRLEDEQHFTSVRRLVQHEDYMLHLMARVGVRSAEPIGIVEITPEREYLLVTEFLDDAVEISDVELDDDLIDDALDVVDLLWSSGLAHRDIKPSNVMVRDGRVHLIDVAFAQVRPSPWRQAVDLANMMMVLALQSSPEHVYERARRTFSDDELAEAFAASRGVTLPSQLRRAVRSDGRDLLVRFRELAPARPPVSIQRWSLRRVGLTAGVVAIAAAVVMVFLASLEDVGLR
jgi:tRNA A-37 threonylcarbamoyl transferase component Bud32/membrane-associated phospholipid phosphatase